MNLIVLNTDLMPISIVDTYESLIWTDRYYAYGDFELCSHINNNMLEIIKQDYYLQCAGSEHVMIIDKILIKSDVENGNSFIASGKSLESILKRRIVWKQTTISGNLQNGIQTLLNENVISPSDIKRKINNFIFEASADPAITGLAIEAQYTGDDLYDVISKICSERGIGFKITLNEKRQFVFKLYAGIDRSYNQIENPYVIFSPNFENIVNSNYMESKAALKNVTLIGGEGEGAARKYTSIGDAGGLDRREIFTDARDISSDTGDGIVLTDGEYEALLIQRGKENLAGNTAITSFEGQVDTESMYRYGEDFFNGDVVQFENEYGHEATARIIEIVISESEDEISIYPTLKT